LNAWPHDIFFFSFLTGGITKALRASPVKEKRKKDVMNAAKEKGIVMSCPGILFSF